MHKTHNQKTTRRPPLDEVQAFVDVATAGSFSAAAEQIGVAHSSLSRKVAHLEQWLGVSLLQRTQQGVNLTGVGLQYFLRFREGLSLIEMPDRGDASNASEVVQISTLGGFAAFWLFPRHDELTRRAGSPSLRYELNRIATDFTDGTDLAIRYGPGSWLGTRSVRLFKEDVQPLAGAGLGNDLGPDAPPADILQHPLVHVGTEKAWRTWFEAQGVFFTMREFDLLVDDHHIAEQAIVHGLGIGLSRPMWRHKVDGTHLIHVSLFRVPVAHAYYIVRPDNRPLRRSARRVAVEIMREAGIGDVEAEFFVS